MPTRIANLDQLEGVQVAMVTRAPPIVLDERKVAVFLVEVPSSAGTAARLLQLLDEAERGRATRLIRERDRHLYVVAHALLRYALWRMTAEAGWRFCVDRFGKPELDPPFGNPPLRFSLSHSGTLAACAIAIRHDVGIDLEAIDPSLDFNDIAATQFAAGEQAQLAARKGPRRIDAFYQLWTLREAVTKAIGHGVSGEPQDLAFTLEPLSLAICPPSAGCWHIEQRKIRPRHWAALAVHHPSPMTMSVEWHSVDAAAIVAGLALS